MNVNVCVHAHLLKPVCVHACVYLVEFYFVKFLSSYLVEFTYISLSNFGSTIITLGIVKLELL